MPKNALIVGSAGSGKTTRLLNLMEKLLARGTSPTDIGFVSFTKVARREASSRAADRMGCDVHLLEQEGWFRTLHSCTYRLLGIRKAQMLSDNADDKAWIEQATGEPVSGGSGSENDDGYTTAKMRTGADTVLAIWSAARSRLLPFSDIHAISVETDDATPDMGSCRRIVEAYEQGKRLDGRLDFTDILGQYAGKQFRFDGPVDVEPEGDVPQLTAWFLDEAQDQSALIDLVARRLVSASQFCYLVGDAFQSIFSFAGSDPALFQAWDFDKREVLRQSYRCPAPIVELGEECIRDCSDYWDREVIPAPHDGDIESVVYPSDWPSLIDPTETWLLLARTNYGARRLGKRLDGNGIPWAMMKGGSKWSAPSRNAACRAMMELQYGGVITVSEWLDVLKYCPAKLDANNLLERGTKTRWKKYDGPLHELNNLEGMAKWGATPRWIEAVKGHRWRSWIKNADEYVEAVTQWGMGIVEKTNVIVSTIHGAKGAEADNVVILPTTSGQVAASRDTTAGADEEARIAYVAVTRTRKRLIIAREPRVQHQMGIWE